MVLKAHTVDYFSLEQYVAEEQEILSRFFGIDITISPPPEELSKVMLKAKEIDWSQAEAHFLPNISLERYSNFPGWTIKPVEWFWKRIQKNELGRDAAILDGDWVIADGSQKPEYKEGKQMYENDPFAKVIRGLRKAGKIQIPLWVKSISQDSRFAISYDEIQNFVNSAISNLLDVHPDRVRLPRAIEHNFLSNLYHPELGKTTSWEWCQDLFSDGLPLLWGRSFSGGLGAFNCTATIRHGDHIGFRTLIVFPRTSNKKLW